LYLYSIGHSTNNRFAECHIKNTRQAKHTRQKTCLPSARRKTLSKESSNTWQRKNTRQTYLFAKCFFLLGLGKQGLCRVLKKNTQQREIQFTFWSSKLIHIKKFSTIKLYNFSHVQLSSFDKAIATLLTKSISLI